MSSKKKMEKIRVDDIGEIMRKENERIWRERFFDRLAEEFKPDKELLELVHEKIRNEID